MMRSTTNSRFCGLLLAAILSLAASDLMAQRGEPVTTSSAEPWQTQDFPIGFWCGPPPDFVTVERYQQIKDAGFTHVMPNCVVSGTIEENRRVLDTAEKVGLRAFVHDLSLPIGVPDEAASRRIREIVDEYREYPALAGYFLVDEPGAGAFPTLAQTVAALREADPDHVAYINIHPNYASREALGTPTYEAHVEQFLEIVRPAIVSYDHYSFLLSTDRPGFFENLELVRRESAKRQLPFWQIVLLTDHAGFYRRPTEAEKRWQAMQTLAHGGKGLMYFTYWQPAATPEWGEAVIDFDGSPTAQYDEVERINRDVQAIGKYLLPARSTDVFRSNERGSTFSACNGRLRLEGADLTVGVFEHEKMCYVLLANHDYSDRATVRFSASTGGAALERLDKVEDRWEPVSAALVLAAGDGELYRWTGS